MSPAEIGFRVRRKLQSTLERAGFGLARVGLARAGQAHAPTPGATYGQPWVSPLPRSFDASKYIRAADRILSGTFDVFALKGVRLGFPPRWNVDPKTGTQAPLPFGKTLDYRDSAVVGDIKYLWEINRHLELVTLAQAWHLSGDLRYAHGCRDLLESWFAQCPYPLGAHWCVSLEHGVRLVNWSCAWFLLGGERSELFATSTGQGFRDRWQTSIYQHCHFIARHWSRHSSANNHLLGEATGLFVGATTWPLWRESSRWAAVAQKELCDAALEQTFTDGVNKEQAVWYHHAVADMMLIAGLFARANHRDLGGEYWERLQRMFDFLASIMDVAGNVPAIGDADEGVLVRFAQADESAVFRSLLATGAVLFNSPPLAFKAGSLDDKSRWLLGDGAQAQFAAVELSQAQAQLPVRRDFAAGGYYVLGEHFETAAEVRIVADAAPLGYLAIAAHGHADALAFTLSVGGKPMLVDAGTFAYHTEPRWRRYFKGTSAHNTLAVDAEDQSVFGGNFLWSRHAVTSVHRFEASARQQELVASHDGYCRLADPVRHRRTWNYQDSSLTIIDELECAGTHSVELFWHLHPECVVTQRGNVVVARRDGSSVEITCPTGLTAMLFRGFDPASPASPDSCPPAARRSGPLGWYSTGFDTKTATTTVVFAGEIRGNARFSCELRIGAAAG